MAGGVEVQSLTVEQFSWFVVEHQQPVVAALCVEGTGTHTSLLTCTPSSSPVPHHSSPAPYYPHLHPHYPHLHPNYPHLHPQATPSAPS